MCRAEVRYICLQVLASRKGKARDAYMVPGAFSVRKDTAGMERV